MSRSLAVIPLMMVLASAACAIDSPTAPYAEEASLAAPTGFSASQSASAGQSLDFDGDLNFIDSLVPSFNDAGSGARFGDLMKEMRTHLNAGDKGEARRVVDLARQELASGALNDGDAGYIEMVFRNLDEALVQ